MKKSLIWQFFEFLRYQKKMWMFPIVVLLLLAGIAVVFVESSAVSAFIYAMF